MSTILAGRASLALASVLATALGACAVDDAPAAPSWQVDVLPIIAGNCVRCHSVPRRGGAGARLDTFVDASPLATTMQRRVSRVGLLTSPTESYMPPGRSLAAYELAVLENWAASADTDGRGQRGAGRADNQPPSVVVTDLAITSSTVSLRYDLADADHDYVTGTVVAVRGSEEDNLGFLIPGVDQVSGSIDAERPGGDWRIELRLDDGADIDGPDGDDDYLVVELGTLIKDPPPPAATSEGR